MNAETNTATIQKHYASDGLRRRVKDALQGAGFGTGPIEWTKLAPIDQFHVRGLAATKELADALNLMGGETVLDVGCGLGGPARFLAATYNCSVTGIDLTPEYVAIAEMLGERTGLADHLTFVHGNALELPFPDETFDHAWTQHTAMNISDKETFYREIYRVLKKGGRLASYDAVTGSGEPLVYPVPWAPESSISFLASPDEMMQVLTNAGFHELSVTDKTPEALAWFAGLQASLGAGLNAEPFSLAAVLGSNKGENQSMAKAVGNFGRNLAEGRARLLQVIVQKYVA